MKKLTPNHTEVTEAHRNDFDIFRKMQCFSVFYSLKEETSK